MGIFGWGEKLADELDWNNWVNGNPRKFTAQKCRSSSKINNRKEKSRRNKATKGRFLAKIKIVNRGWMWESLVKNASDAC